MVELRYPLIHYYSIAVLGLNLSTIVLGLTFLSFPGESAFWDFSGWIFLSSWTSTIMLALLAPQILVVLKPTSKRTKRLGYITIAVLDAAKVSAFALSLLLSTSNSNAISEIGSALVLLYASFFGCSAMNSYFAFNIVKQTKNSKLVSPKEKKTTPKTAKPRFSSNKKLPLLHIGILLIGSMALGLMVYFAIISLVGVYLDGINGLMGVISASFGWLFSIFTWSTTVGGIKILRRLHLPRLAIGFGLIGLITGSILLAPMIAVPSIISEVNTGFGEAYGADWEERIPPSAMNYFKSNQLIAAEYFLSKPLNDCIVKENISFYNGSTGNEEGLQLFFDAYLPPLTNQPLPGANSTLIRIHGGGFTIGDKGIGNMPLMNRYFAAQGYCVFDIQYGLINRSSLLSFGRIITPEHVIGNYSVNDMLRHIGLFCQYLTNHQSEYPANLSSAFISGGSAGGHLTCATALAIASGNYTSTFGSELNIKGYVPFYPAIDLESKIDGGVSNQEFYSPASLISANSPPCLIYHGNQDGLVAPQNSIDIKDRYTNQANPACLTIFLPFAGHGSDINFYGYYNQFFLYYMERFLYLHR